MTFLKRLLPFIILFALFGLLWRELFYAKPNELPSALIGDDVPAFKIPQLYQPRMMFTEKNLVGHVALLNVWASWCYACAIEQPILMKIKDQYHVPIYGINYKDQTEDAKNWLHKNGNPYVLIGEDKFGDVGIDLGIYGTPETFVLSPQGKILYRHVGAIDQKSWDEILYPMILKYSTQ